MTFETEREADFGTRLLAALMDGLVVGLLYGLITEAYLLVTIATDRNTTMGEIPGMILLSVWGAVGYFAEGFFDGILVAFAPSQMFSHADDMSLVWLTVGLIAANWLYHAIMESSAAQATLGKKAMHLRVTNMNGERISFVRATARHFLKSLSSLLLLVGFFLPMISERKQTLHDKLSGCLIKQGIMPQPLRPEQNRQS